MNDWTIAELQQALNAYDPASKVRLAIASKNGLSTTFALGHLSQSTPEVHGLEIVLHPNFDEEI